MKNRSRKRRGYSLVEVLVAVALLGAIGGAMTKLVVSQMRFFDTVNISRGSRNVARNSMNVVLSDLRMVQDSGGVDSIASSGKYLRAKVPYMFGVFCNVTGGNTYVSMLPVDSSTQAFSKFAGYGYRDRTTGRFVNVASTTVPTVAGDATPCTTTATVKTITLNGRSGAVYTLSPGMNSKTARGSAVYFYQRVAYYFASSTLYPGKTGLWRSVEGGITEELMAPFDASAGFRFYKAGQDTSVTTVPAVSDLRGVDLVLTAQGSRLPAGRKTSMKTQMVTSVFFKSTRTP